MSGLRRRLFFLSGLGILTLTGCHRWCCRPSFYPPTSSSALIRTHALAPAPAPCPAPSAFLAPPAPSAPLEPSAPPALGAPLPSDPPAAAEPRWGPAREPSATLLPPEPAPERPLVPSPKADIPQSKEPPPLDRPPANEDRPAPARPPAEDPTTAKESPPLPPGIFGFAPVKEGVATGRRPLGGDGFDWLKTRGYKAVLYIRAPNVDDSSDRKVATDRGLAYQSLEVSPERLTAALVEDFNRAIADTARQPLFVYGDGIGMATGSLWYLHFRTAGGLGDAEARKKAVELGLKEDENGVHKDMWLAIQKYLRDNKIP